MIGRLPSSVAPSQWCTGLLFLDKPSGMTSRHAATQMVKALGLPPKIKWGFVGTLDPMATGLLPIALGMGTKAIPYVESLLADKTYQATFALGQTRVGDDATGAVSSVAVRISRRRLKLLQQSVHAWGDLLSDLRVQRPPDFSAKHVGGRRAYQWARAGQEITIPPSPVQVKSALRVESVSHPELQQVHSTWELCLSRGGYVRSLARDFGLDGGVGGHVVSIRRIQMGEIRDTDLPWESVGLNVAFVPFSHLLGGIPHPLLKRIEMSCRISPIQLRGYSHHPASRHGADDQECHNELVTRAQRNAV